MRAMVLLFAFTTLVSTPLLAQQSIGNPNTAPDTGAPGTSTPQPYKPLAPQPLPRTPANSVPLLKPATLPERSHNRRDQDLPLLREQRERNAQPLIKPSE
ncbi:MAG: hypothetical protein KAX70_07365 [Pseudomonas sp.]|nr:hypothetical protein [Pseudomonas sp.]